MKKLTPEQQAARNVMAAIIANIREADRRYDAFTESRGGRIISTDLARFLDVRYRDTPADQARDLFPGWDLAWRYSHSRLEREIKNRRGRDAIQFMAGGWGAGKTYALERASVPEQDLAWDGTLKDQKWGRAMIDLALKHGWRVVIAYVFRDIELALYGAIERAGTEGRSVPLANLPGNHRAVQHSIRTLIKRYRNENRVAFTLLHNTGAKNVRGPSLVIGEAELAPRGALHYSKEHENYYAEAARKIEALN